MKVEAPETPTAQWSYDDHEFWDAEALERELRRVGYGYEIDRKILRLE